MTTAQRMAPEELRRWYDQAKGSDVAWTIEALAIQPRPIHGYVVRHPWTDDDGATFWVDIVIERRGYPVDEPRFIWRALILDDFDGQPIHDPAAITSGGATFTSPLEAHDAAHDGVLEWLATR